MKRWLALLVLLAGCANSHRDQPSFAADFAGAMASDLAWCTTVRSLDALDLVGNVVAIALAPGCQPY